MKKRIQSLSFLAILGVVVGMISWGSTLHAQQAPTSPPNAQTQQPQAPPPDSTPAQTPDTPPSSRRPSAQTPPDASASPNGTDNQVFSGTVQKQGDKYVLKDDSGKIYDIDHQTDVAKFDGKRVRVQGTLDPSGRKIMVK